MAVKSGIIAGPADRALQVISSQTLANEELARIQQVMVNNGYPNSFIGKAIKKQVRKRNLGIDKGKEKATEDDRGIVTTSIPFVDGLSQEVRPIAREAGVKCAFYAEETLQDVYAAKDHLPTDMSTHAVYSIKCGTS